MDPDVEHRLAGIDESLAKAQRAVDETGATLVSVEERQRWNVPTHE